MTIRKYVLDHLIRYFLGAALVLYAVVLIVQVVRIGGIVSLGDFDLFFLALIPMAVFVLPMSVVFSVLMVLEKLSVESEIIAMQACGLPLRKLYAPVLLLAVMCMLIHLSISTYVGPLAMQRIQARLISKAPEKVYSFLEEREFIDTFKGLTLYIESVNRKEKRLGNVFIETSGKEHSVIVAEKGTLQARPSGVLMRLSSGSVFMESKQSLRYITFDEYDFFLEADFRREMRLRSMDSLTLDELRQHIRQEGRKPKVVKEYYNRFAFPLLNVILAVVGLQFGIQKPRSPKRTGMVVGFGAVLGYYLAFLFADRLVKGGALNPTLGAFVPDIVFCLLIVSVWAARRFAAGKGGM